MGENLCPCTRNPTQHSCVDLIMSGLDEAMISVARAIKHDTELKNNLETCECARHRDERQRKSEGEIIKHSFEKLLNQRPETMIEATCCEAVADQYLAKGVGSTMMIPKFIPWKCVRENCLNCGIVKLQMNECPILSEYTKKFSCMIWKKVEIEKTTKKQEELVQVEMQLKDILVLLRTKLDKARRHYVTYKWVDHVRALNSSIAQIGNLYRLLCHP